MSTSEQLLTAAGVGTKYKNVQRAGVGSLAPAPPPAPPAKPPKRSASGGIDPGTAAAEVSSGGSGGPPSPAGKKPPPPPPPKKTPSASALGTTTPAPQPTPAASVNTSASPRDSAQPAAAAGTAAPSTPSKRFGMLSGLMKRASLSTKSILSDGGEPAPSALPSRPYTAGSDEGARRLLELEEMLDHEESLASRVLLREGTLDKLNRDKYSPYHFILTTDALIYCTLVSGGERLRLNRTFPLSALLIAPSEQERPNSSVEFKLLTTIKSFYVLCESAAARESWCADIERAASAMQQSVGKAPQQDQMAPCLAAGVSTMLRRLSTQASGVKLDCHVNKKYTSHEDNSRRLLELEEMLDHEESLASRVLLREGTLDKLNRDKYSPYHFILTTDALIYCTPSIMGDKMKHNRTLPLSTLIVGRGGPERPQAEQEFKIMTPRKSFMVLTATPVEAASWVEDIQAAASSAYRVAGNAPDLSSMAPLWETDCTADGCTICNDPFTLLNRRHHCRNCGAIVCELCSKEKLRTKVDDKRLQRVCARCAEQLKASRKYGVESYS